MGLKSVVDFALSEARICLPKRRQSSQPMRVVVGSSSYPDRRLGRKRCLRCATKAGEGKVVTAR